MDDVSPQVFVGRHRELDELCAALAAAQRQHGSSWVVTGEAGVGKSSLVTAFAVRAASAGARVLWGRCRRLQGVPAYWPWAQVLRPLLEQGAPSGANPERERLAGMVSALGGGTATAAGALPADRFRFFDSVSRFVRAVAAEQPLVLIFEDMHDADAASLLLLRFVAAEVAGARVLLVATSRSHVPARAPDEEVDGGVAAALHGTSSRSLSLGGLSLAELTALLDRWGLPEQGVVTVWQRTGGNPFFAIEIARSLAGRSTPRSPGPGLAELPPGVRLILQERLASLAGPAQDLLGLAAVCGRQFPLGLIARSSGLSPGQIGAVLAPAVEIGVLDRPPSDHGSYRFTHDLLREAVYAQLAPERRMRLHGDVATALEALSADGPDEQVDEIARHFLAAAPAGYQRQAIDFAVRAGRRCAAHLAYEQAEEFFDQALRLVRASEPREARLECEIELDAGHALLRSGRPDEAKRLFLAAARRAQTQGLPELLARGALGYGGQWSFTGETPDPRLVDLLEAALRGLPGQAHDGLRVRLLARLAEELYHSSERAAAQECSARALELARRLHDPAALASALLARLFVLWRPSSPDHLQERLQLDAEVLELAAATGDVELELDGAAWRISDLLEAGDVVGAQEQMAAFGQTAATLRQPFYLWFVEVFATLHALMQGRYAEAEQHAEEALMIGRRGQGRRELLENAMSAHTVHTMLLRREHSRPGPDTAVDQGAASVDAVLERFPRQPAWRAAIGLRLLATGQVARARAHYEVLAAQRFRALLSGDASLIAVALTAELAAVFGDADQIDQLRCLLVPFAGRHVVIGHPAMAYHGCVDHYLGLLELAAGRVEAALGHLQEASRRQAAMGATPWVARTDYIRARVHLGRAAGGDEAAAIDLLERAEQIATELGMAPLRREIAELRGGGGGPHERQLPEAGGISRQHPAVFARDGDVWSITLGPETARISDLKGMHYLQRLLAEEGREFHALDLASGTLRDADAGPAALADGLRLDSGDAGPLLDEQAKRAYRLRLHQLRAEEAEAEEMGHGERAGRAREEIEALAGELARAVGLGGRDRRAASQSERARVNVSRAIRAAIDRIARHAPSLGHHLATTVRTGIYCVYEPDPTATPQWRTARD